MSIGFGCGGVPSSLMVPVTLPPEGGAALTLRCAVCTASPISSIAEKIALSLYLFRTRILEFSLLLVLVVCLVFVWRSRSRSRSRSCSWSCWCIWIDWFQTQLLRDLFFLGVHGLKCAQVEHQVPSLVRLHIISKRWHG